MRDRLVRPGELDVRFGNVLVITQPENSLLRISDCGRFAARSALRRTC